MECSKISTCVFFNNKEKISSVVEFMKQRFCKGHFENCARYILSQKLGIVPPVLYPNQIDRAKQIIADAGLIE